MCMPLNEPRSLIGYFSIKNTFKLAMHYNKLINKFKK